MAYSHNLENELFVPTRHQHNTINLEEEVESHWDHDIYSFNTFTTAGNNKMTVNNIYLDRNKVPEFSFPQVYTFNKKTIKGTYRNGDISFEYVK